MDSKSTNESPVHSRIASASANPEKWSSPASGGGRQRWFPFVIGTILIGAFGFIGIATGLIPNPLAVHGSTVASEEKQSHEAPLRIPTVKVVRPKQDQTADILLERMATVEPYYRADLRTRASGIVKAAYFDIGDEVKRGETLIEIDVPESLQDIAQKKALIVQREQELKVSEAKRKDAQAALAVTNAVISQRQADVQAITATRDLKKRRLDRYQDLASRGSVVGSVVEEEERDYFVSEAALLAAKANVSRAEADHAEAASKVETAAADVDLKRSQIDVAKTDLDRAMIIADYSKVVAPFDGVVVRRNVDAGSFVQNATSGNSETLISVARIDLLTIVSYFPDNAAQFIDRGTPASIQIADFAGGAISSKVTRISPTIQNSDRTMRVEVDVFNGDVKARAEAIKLEGASKVDHFLKGRNSTFPDAAFAEGESLKRLLPGMNGSLRLAVGGSVNSQILPSTAVFSRSGAKYILVVVNGKTEQKPVRVQLNDGQRVRLAIVSRTTSTDGTVKEELTGLRGDEDVVANSQLQVGEGVEVRVSPIDW